MKIIKKDRHETYRELGEYLKNRKDNEFFNTEIKKWKPLKTQRELGLFFEGIEYLLLNNPEYGYVTENLKELIYRGIVEKYSLREPAGFIITDEYGNEKEPLVPIPLRKINRTEDFEAVLNGLINEMHEKGVDPTEFIDKWESLRRARIDREREALEVTP